MQISSSSPLPHLLLSSSPLSPHSTPSPPFRMVAAVSQSVSVHSAKSAKSANRVAGSVITPEEEARFRQMTKNQKELLDVQNPFKRENNNNSISDEDNHTDDKFIVHQHATDLLTCTNGRVSFNSEAVGKAVVKCNLKISNLLEKPIAFKIKSTSSKLFHIKTPRGILQPYGNTAITISFRGSFIPSDLAHYIGVFGVILEDKNAKYDAKKIFDDKRDKEDFMRRMFISYAKTVKQSDTYLTVLRNMKAEQKSG